MIGRLLALLLIASACRDVRGDEPITLRFWAMGREGEVVQQLVRAFENANPGIRVRVQQIPWTAAHEKLLTAFVGDATPDVSQLGNTWVPEFSSLGGLEPLDRWVGASTVVDRTDYFPGIWATNVIEDTTFGVPWYVDTRVLFYRTDLLARAGYSAPPTTWQTWLEVMRRLEAQGAPDQYAILLPLDEWAQPAIFGLQNASPLLRDGGRYGAFSQPAFREAFEFYIGMFKSGLAPTVANQQVANVYQEFARGTFALYITGPWNIGEFRQRLPADVQDDWATAPLPGPADPARGVSIAGGSSLVMFSGSSHKAEAWKLIEYLSAPEQQLRFYQLTGDLPARRSAWRDSLLAGDTKARAFFEQLQRVEPLPKVPEWELIASRLAQTAEQAARGRLSVEDALAGLDRDVDQILEKRRWMLARKSGAPTPD